MDIAQEKAVQTEEMHNLARAVMPPDIKNRAWFSAPAARTQSFYFNCAFTAQSGEIFTIHFVVDRFYITEKEPREQMYRVDASVTTKLLEHDAIRQWVIAQLTSNLKAGHWFAGNPHYVVYSSNRADADTLRLVIAECLDRMDELAYMLVAAEKKLRTDFSTR